jgi:hypothetical protein
MSGNEADETVSVGFFLSQDLWRYINGIQISKSVLLYSTFKININIFVVSWLEFKLIFSMCI